MGCGSPKQQLNLQHHTRLVPHLTPCHSNSLAVAVVTMAWHTHAFFWLHFPLSIGSSRPLVICLSHLCILAARYRPEDRSTPMVL